MVAKLLIQHLTSGGMTEGRSIVSENVLPWMKVRFEL